MSASPAETPVLLHLASREAWAAACWQGSLRPPSLQAEGYVHLSTERQVLATAARHFVGAGHLLALRVAPERLDAPLRWDPVAALGQDFPHLYGPLPTEAVVALADLTESPEGWSMGAFRAGRSGRPDIRS